MSSRKPSRLNVGRPEWDPIYLTILPSDREYWLDSDRSIGSSVSEEATAPEDEAAARKALVAKSAGSRRRTSSPKRSPNGTDRATRISTRSGRTADKPGTDRTGTPTGGRKREHKKRKPKHTSPERKRRYDAEQCLMAYWIHHPDDPENNAARSMQRVRRGHSTRRQFLRKKGSAVLMQRLHRGQSTRKRLRASAALHDRERAVVRLQAASRGRAVRKDLGRKLRAQREVAATKIAAVVRGRNARRAVQRALGIGDTEAKEVVEWASQLAGAEEVAVGEARAACAQMAEAEAARAVAASEAEAAKEAAVLRGRLREFLGVAHDLQAAEGTGYRVQGTASAGVRRDKVRELIAMAQEVASAEDAAASEALAKADAAAAAKARLRELMALAGHLAADESDEKRAQLATLISMAKEAAAAEAAAAERARHKAERARAVRGN